MFIESSQLTIQADEATKNQLISEIEGVFCALLPLEETKRTISFYTDEVYLVNGWLKVNTQLLNISEVKQSGESIAFNAVGKSCQELFFKGNPTFNPLLELEVKSWFTAENLPWDIKGAMMEMIEDRFSLLQQWNLTEKSIKMWPREVEYATDFEFKKIAFKSEALKQKVWEILARYSW